MTATAREDILARIHSALPHEVGDIAGSYASIPRPYHRTGTLSANARLALFIDRLLDYETEVIQILSESEIPPAIAQAMQNLSSRLAVVPAQFPAQWLPREVSLTFDQALTTEEIEQAGSVITTCEVAIASTGTIILVHQGSQGRRILTLLPDHHVCLVKRDQIVEVVPEATAAIDQKAALPTTTISGPSATADIEMTRIRGVHGPRRLTVILY